MCYTIVRQKFNLYLAKAVGHGYVFSMAVDTIGDWLKLVPFLFGDEQLIPGGGGGGLHIKKEEDHFYTLNVFHFCQILDSSAPE